MYVHFPVGVFPQRTGGGDLTSPQKLEDQGGTSDLPITDTGNTVNLKKILL